jgi:hypothetical protein
MNQNEKTEPAKVHPSAARPSLEGSAALCPLLTEGLVFSVESSVNGLYSSLIEVIPEVKGMDTVF